MHNNAGLRTTLWRFSLGVGFMLNIIIANSIPPLFLILSLKNKRDQTKVGLSINLYMFSRLNLNKTRAGISPVRHTRKRFCKYTTA